MKKFEKDCRAVSEQLGIEVDFYYNEKCSDVFEDDGFLHIHKKGMRAAFIIGQDLPAAEANERTRAILTALGMENKIGKRVLVDETSEIETFHEDEHPVEDEF